MKVTSQINTFFEQKKQLEQDMQKELHDLLHWWLENMVDEQKGGFYGRIDGHGELHPQADKGVVLNTRILWTFSAATRITGNAQYKEMANRAYDYLIDHFWDAKSGGVFWMLNHQGQPLQTKKQIYAQAFAIYALAEYHRITENQHALTYAYELFKLIEQHSRDKENGGYFEAFDQFWQPLEDLRLSNKDANEAKTMNTHLHVLEAYTNLYRIHPTKEVQKTLESLIRLFLEKFIDLESHHLHLFFDEKWRLKSHEISFGHDIECSWLLVEAAEVLGKRSLAVLVKENAVQLANAVYERGIDNDGSLFYEADSQKLTNVEKHWWPQAEAVVGWWNAFKITGKQEYADAAFKTWNFIKTYLRDEENGEWHWRVDLAGQPCLEEDKAGPWKAPYHNGRMCIEMFNLKS